MKVTTDSSNRLMKVSIGIHIDLITENEIDSLKQLINSIKSDTVKCAPTSTYELLKKELCESVLKQLRNEL